MRASMLSMIMFTAMGQAAVTSAAPVVLSSPFITGSSIYTAADFAAAIGPHVGMPVTRASIKEISAQIQALYRRDGYAAPGIVVPDSELSSSMPRLHIVEPRVAEVAIRGDAGPYFDRIARDSKMLQSNIVHKQRSQIYLRRIEELPGLQVRAVFEPRREEPNSYTLVLNVSYEAVGGGVCVNNRGTTDLGRVMTAAHMSFNGLLGAREALTLFGGASTESDVYHYAGMRAERRFGVADVTVDAASSRAAPDDGSRYSIDRVRAEVRLTAFDDGQWRVEPVMALAARDSSGKDDQRHAFDITRTRVVEVGIAARRAIPGSTTRIRSMFSQGIDSLGAAATTRYGAVPDLAFNKAAIEILHMHALSKNWRVRIDLDGQWSADDLPAGERFTFGGTVLGRAFDPATLIGDSGAALGLQLERLGLWQSASLTDVRAYVQADAGFARSNYFAAGADAASVTFGVGGKIAAMLLSLELSQSLHDPYWVRNAGGPRAFANMRVSF